MTRIAAAVDPTLLGRLLEWTQEFADIEAHHAADGLYIGAACRHDGLPEDPEAVFLFGLVITFWFWFDDRSDRFLCGPETWDALVALGDDPTYPVTIDRPELRFFQRLGEALRRRAGDPAEHRWWMARSADVFRAMYAEEKMSRAGLGLSYAESLEIGADSTGLTSIISAADLAHGMNRAARGADRDRQQKARWPDQQRYDPTNGRCDRRCPGRQEKRPKVIHLRRSPIWSPNGFGSEPVAEKRQMAD